MILTMGNRRLHDCWAFALASILLIFQAQGAGTAYLFVDLAPPGSVDSRAEGVSGGQQVGWVTWRTGYPDPLPYTKASLWNGSLASLVDLHPAGFEESYCFATSGSQQVGSALTLTNSHALLWSGSAASVVDLHPAGYAASGAKALAGTNQYGIGYPIQSERSHALMWSGSAASVVDLHPPGYYDSGIVAAYGDQQVGTCMTMGGELRAVLWHGTALSAVDLTPAGYYGALADAVSHGQQVGSVYPTAQNVYHAALWSGSAESFVDLHPSGYAYSTATGTDGNMQVGAVTAAVGSGLRATVWYGDAASAVDLHQYVPKGVYVDSVAYDIDENGVIVGIATDWSYLRHAVMWVPVVVPSLAVAVSGQNLEISFTTESGFTDQLESTSVLGGHWTDKGIPVSGTGGKVTIPVQMSPGYAGEFFRIRRFQ